MINGKTYIPITRNNRIRAELISRSRPSNFITSDDLNKEISINKKRNKQYKSFKIHGATFKPPTNYNAPTYDINIDFDLTSIPVTSYDPGGNENDRPRINTFREDGQFTIFLSAGGIYEDPITHIRSTPPWGDRSTGSFSTSIPINDTAEAPTLSAGVDVFASSTMQVYLTPLSTNWFISDSNPGEKKYQLLFNTEGTKNVGVTILSAQDSIPTETFAISASFINANAGTGWGSAWKFSTNGGNAVDRNGELDPSDSYGSNRTLNFNMGDTIRFENLGLNEAIPREVGQPFFIKTQPTFDENDQAEGVVFNGTALGPIYFTPTAPGTYYYVDVNDGYGGNQRNFGLIIIT